VPLGVEGRSSTAATLQTLLAKLLILATNLATGVITARSSGLKGGGTSCDDSMATVLAYIDDARPTSALLFKRYPEKESELFSAALLLSTALGIIATLTGVVFIPVWLAQYSAEVIYIASGL